MSIAAAATASINITVSGVPTTGMVLRQVNISFGSTGTSNSGNVNDVTMRLRDVSGALSTMLSPTSFDGAVGDFRLFDIHLRDNSVLKTPAAQKAALSSTIQKGYPFHYGYYKPEGSFSGYNTTGSVNGTWKLVLNNGAGGARVFTKVELIFGPAINAIDIRTTKTNTSCATKQCIDATNVFYATNDGYPTGQAVTPPNTVGGCAWNGQKDNNSWFFFQASASTAYVSISGFSTVQESSVFTVSDCSASATYGIVAGGCGPSDMFTPSNHIQKYYEGTYAGGYGWNHGYYLTGLVTGNNYIFVIDGSAAAKSSFYAEILGGATDCAIVLPIELLYFNGENLNGTNNLSWATATEINNAYFELEKSDNGIDFTSIATIKNKATSSDNKHTLNYNYTDVSGKAYYRLKQVDISGSFKNHKIIFIENGEEKKEPLITPNPVKNQLTIAYYTGISQKNNITIQDVYGNTVFIQDFVSDLENNQVILNIQYLTPGLYFLSTNNGITRHQQKIIKE